MFVTAAVMRHQVGWFDSDEHSSSVLTTKIASCGTMVGVAISHRTPICIQCFASLCVAITVAFTIQWEIAAVTLILIPFTTIGGSFKVTSQYSSVLRLATHPLLFLLCSRPMKLLTVLSVLQFPVERLGASPQRFPFEICSFKSFRN